MYQYIGLLFISFFRTLYTVGATRVLEKYWLVMERMNWRSAMKHCQGQQGGLAIHLNREEEDKMYSLIRSGL